MIKINVMTGNLLKIKSFNNKDELYKYSLDNFLLLIGNDINGLMSEAEDISNKIWKTNVGQSLKTPLGHIVTVSGKSFNHNREV
jgi:hypothetical protein